MLFVVDGARIFAAGGWIFVSSKESMAVHVMSFIIYVFLSILVAMLLPVLLGRLADLPRTTALAKAQLLRARTAKRSLLLVQGAALLYAIVAHGRHRRCVPGAYSHFALAEWAFALGNILFDGSTFLEFATVDVHVRDRTMQL